MVTLFDPAALSSNLISSNSFVRATWIWNDVRPDFRLISTLLTFSFVLERQEIGLQFSAEPERQAERQFQQTRVSHRRQSVPWNGW